MVRVEVPRGVGLEAHEVADDHVARDHLHRLDQRRHLAEIAWETEVWVADAPSHLIHFNGERFLGPYPAE